MPPTTTFGKVCKFFCNFTTLYIIPCWYIISTFLLWQNMSVCFRREAVLNSVLLVYFGLPIPKGPHIYLEILLIIMMFWFVDRTNSESLLDEPNCLNTNDSFYFWMTESFFKFIFWLYAFVASLSVTILIGVIILRIVHFICQRQMGAQQGLTEAELRQLEHVKFVLLAEIQRDPSLSTCTICLEEFQEGMDVIQLPCNHHYHPDCVNAWLKFHILCPICQTNIRSELGSGQRERSRNDLQLNNQIEESKENA